MVLHIQCDQIHIQKLEDRSNDLLNLVVTNKNGLVHTEIDVNNNKLVYQT